MSSLPQYIDLAPLGSTLMPRAVPFLKPNPPRLSRLGRGLENIEDSGIFSNYGPVNTQLETSFVEQLFHGVGACLTVCNATLGLMIAMKSAADKIRRSGFVIVPSLTFAATAHAVLWAGLTPIFCDVDADTWLLDEASVGKILAQYGDAVVGICPYATFGNNLDLSWYDRLADEHNLFIVVDAAASLGSLNHAGQGFGTGFRHAIVYSMHATKTFAVGEGGLVYSADPALISRLRIMSNFGFGEPRTATMAGLNCKLPEVSALMGLEKLRTFAGVVEHREMLAGAYRHALPAWCTQRMLGVRHAYQFMPALMPAPLHSRRRELQSYLAQEGIGSANYFDPHLAGHPYFMEHGVTAALPVTEDIAPRMLSLPISDFMTLDDVDYVCEAVVRWEQKIS
jgi:dTDP-4-amino-4,6-dideoxygalactose transaminase